jgi:hypothetical protein
LCEGTVASTEFTSTRTHSIHTNTNSFPQFLPKARLRVLALQSLLELTRLPYAKLHPYRSQVSRGLLAPLDDRKRLVRQTAVRVRNEWMVMDR